MDQLMVHLSLNHATLPRLNNFFSSLQTGLLNARLTAGGDVMTASYSRRRYGTGKSNSRSGLFGNMKLTRGSVSMHVDPHGSKTQLRLHPHANEISAFVTVEAESTDSPDDPENMARTQGITVCQTVEMQEEPARFSQ